MRPWFPGNMAQSSPLCLMLSPTRELAIQTEKEIQSLIKGSVPPFLRSSAASCALSETLRDLIPSIRLLVTSSLFSDESTPI